ncbi:hypothetical protein V493_06793 [Pseudogymnoascus sp. VKM F-4281 (FW-2241)]|nr:hypothetical protein V493_06793 [Pseudogymnoascus sp. VKM F-4281 (FW-2241)]
MSFARSAFGALRSARLSVGGARAQLVRHSARRGYSSGHGPEASSDLPWAAGAVAVTVPACWYLLKASPEEAHHLHVPHKVEAHAEPEAEAEEEAKEETKEEDTKEEETKDDAPKEVESTEEEPKAEAEASTTDSEEKPSADASKSEDEGKDTTEASKEPTTEAKHSTDVGGDSDISQKAEGTPETSKSKDTVDVSKPSK